MRKAIPVASLGLPALILQACCAIPAPDVPAELKAGPAEKVFLMSAATGVQIYDCKADKNDAAHFSWTFRAPEADLFDKSGAKIGKHFAGPTWEANDGSSVVGSVAAKADAPDAGAIAWLLLHVKSTSGSGTFQGTTSIQRIRTEGGKAPADGCDASQAGNVARVPYKATYVFYKGGAGS